MNTTQRTYASGVTIQLGMLSAAFDLAPVRAKGISRTTVCPTCLADGDIERLHQQMICDQGHVTTLAEAPRALEADGRLIPLTEEDHEALRANEVETGLLDLHVCPSADLEAATRPGEAAYRVRIPRKGRVGEQYALLRELAKSPGLALYGVLKVNGRNNPQPYRLGVWKDQLVVQSLVRPDGLAEVDTIEAEAPAELVEMGRQFMSSIAAPFDADLLSDERKVRTEAILSRGAPTLVPTPAEGLMEQLAAALERTREVA
jgi:hypothetical protein